jgi:4-amino-4-deoxy-L-arabinose transferase-like glycosyltransferase
MPRGQLREYHHGVSEPFAGEPLTAPPPRSAPPSAGLETRSLRWQLWRSPPGQPAWARPLLLLTAALTGLAYGWGMANASVETFYGAAARSMSQNWHDFIFGSFDPAGTITVDKLPGALWVQALSLRVFGFHIWALVLPQVIEGVLTVLVLYRAVRRLAGPVAGLAAAVVLAATPVTVLLGRGNVSDSLLILLLVLAADATSAAIASGKLRWLLLAGVWVGLAFQAKMVQAWLVLPGMAAAYLLAAPAERLRRRTAHVAAAGVITVLVSLSWMTAVTLVPAHDRPYVDGSRNDSVYEQVFDYNGLARLSGNPLTSAAGPVAPFLVTVIQDRQTLNFASTSVRPSWHRLLSGPFGLDGGWLLPAAVLSAIIALRRRRDRDQDRDADGDRDQDGDRDEDSDRDQDRGRRDPVRAAIVLWGAWWVVLAVFFSAGTYLNSYYIAALTPPIAAICGVGVSLCGPPPWSARVRLTILAACAACVGYGLYLLHGAAVVPGWLVPTALAALAFVAYTLLLAPWLTPGSGGRWRLVIPVVACASVLVLPASASATTVIRGLGPFDTPFESHEISTATQSFAANWPRLTAAVQRLEQQQAGFPILFGTDTSILAAPYILASGHEVLPIGGYLGGAPAPTLATLQSDINDGRVQLFVLPIRPASPDPRLRWIEANCTLVQVAPPTPRPVESATPEPVESTTTGPTASAGPEAPTRTLRPVPLVQYGYYHC